MTKKSSVSVTDKNTYKASGAKEIKTSKSKVSGSTGQKGKKKDIKSGKPVHEKESVKHAKEREDCVKKLAETEQKIKEWQDKYLRLSAEFDNYRKRTLKEKSDLLKTGNEELLRDILPVVDNFERGLDTIDKSHDMNAMKEGIHLIYTMFTEFLKQKGIKEIAAKEEPFNIDFHEAMTKIPAPNEELKGKVVDVIEKGYTLNDKVIRYARVVVGE
jgi:molecular chaperone GrpE